MADAKFQERLNLAPNSNEVIKGRKPPKKQQLQYIPISILESKMDSFFAGRWTSEVTGTLVVGNELVVTMKVSYYHPKFNEWHHRSGIGASMVRQRKDSAISDVDGKLKNALEMDAPNAKSKAFKNAVKSIGKAFGRDLMREVQGDFINIEAQKKVSENKILTAINEATTRQGLKDIFDNPKYSLALENAEILQALEVRKNQIVNQKQIG